MKTFKLLKLQLRIILADINYYGFTELMVTAYLSRLVIGLKKMCGLVNNEL